MAGRKKSEWSVKMDELKAELPKIFDGRAFLGCRIDGKWNKDSVAKICKDKGYGSDTESIFAYLTHQDSKPAKSKKVPRIAKIKKIKTESSDSVNLLAKGTYAGLGYTEIEKVISILEGMKDKVKEREIQQKERELARIKEQLDNLKK